MLLDLQRIEADAAERLRCAALLMASPANRLMPADPEGAPISQLATLAASSAATTFAPPPAVLAPDSQDSQRSARASTIEARLIRWGWPPAEAAATAARIARRDDADDRRACIECSRFRLGRCGAHRAAGLILDGVGRDLAGLPQRCPGYAPRADARAEAHRRAPETHASAGDWADRVSVEVSA